MHQASPCPPTRGVQPFPIRRPGGWLLLGMVGACLVLPILSHAGTLAGPDTLVLSLEEALLTAQARNVSMLTAREALEAQGAASRQARGAFWPTLTFGTSYADAWGGVADLRDGDATLTANLAASWTIYSGGGRRAELARQEAARRRAEASLRRTSQDVFVSTIDAYLGLVEALHTREVATHSLRLAEETEAQTIALRDAGKATISDVLRARVSVARQKAELIRASAAVRTAEQNLANVLGGLEATIVPIEPEFEPRSLLEASFDPDLSSLPVVEVAEASLAGARAAMRAQKARFLPRITASATSSWDEVDRAAGEPLRRGTLGLSWSLFEGGTRWWGLQGARASERSARWSLEHTQRQARSDLSQARADMESAKAQWEASKETVRLAETAYEQEKKLYELGRATSLEVLSALETLNDSRRAEISSRYGILRAYARLCALVGRLEPGMFKGSRMKVERG